MGLLEPPMVDNNDLEEQAVDENNDEEYEENNNEEYKENKNEEEDEH